MPPENPYAAPSITAAPPVTVSSGNFNTAGHGQRFLNLLIDTTFLIVLLAVGFVLYAMVTGDVPEEDDTKSETVIQLVFIGFSVCYYAVLESLTGRTLGKVITGTKVVDADGNKPSFGKTLARSLCRNIPFEPFSVLSSDARGWHDSIPKTWVVRTR